MVFILQVETMSRNRTVGFLGMRVRLLCGFRLRNEKERKVIPDSNLSQPTESSVYTQRTRLCKVNNVLPKINTHFSY